MARIRPTNIELIQKLTELHKSYFTAADLGKILGLRSTSLLVTLSRLVKEGVLLRVRKNIYLVFGGGYEIAQVANQLYFPSYLSFEAALSRFGILSQIPYTLTFATSRPPKKSEVGETEIEYSHLKPDLYFGYQPEGGIYVAEPEKALLDELYLISRGMRHLNLEELDLKTISLDKFDVYAGRFPAYMSNLIAQVEKHLGTTPMTNETKGRIEWDSTSKK